MFYAPVAPHGNLKQKAEEVLNLRCPISVPHIVSAQWGSICPRFPATAGVTLPFPCIPAPWPPYSQGRPRVLSIPIWLDRLSHWCLTFSWRIDMSLLVQVTLSCDWGLVCKPLWDPWRDAFPLQPDGNKHWFWEEWGCLDAHRHKIPCCWCPSCLYPIGVDKDWGLGQPLHP